MEVELDTLEHLAKEYVRNKYGLDIEPTSFSKNPDLPSIRFLFETPAGEEINVWMDTESGEIEDDE